MTRWRKGIPSSADARRWRVKQVLGFAAFFLFFLVAGLYLAKVPPFARGDALATAGTPPPVYATTETIRFAVIGDYGRAGPAERDVANLVLGWQPDFVITTGDNNYPRGERTTIDENIGQYYRAFIHPYQGRYGDGATLNRFFPVLGNHDWLTDEAAPYLDYFTLPGNERYYEFVWGPVHFFALDSDLREPDGISRTSRQARWLRARLAASSAPWRIVYLHHPPFSSGSHGSHRVLQWPFRAWGATAVLAGHDHTYERILRDGMLYFVNGLGGASKYPFEAVVSGSQVRFSDDYGAMLVEATSEQITFQFYTRAGELVDTYTITASSSSVR